MALLQINAFLLGLHCGTTHLRRRKKGELGVDKFLNFVEVFKKYENNETQAKETTNMLETQEIYSDSTQIQPTPLP